MARRRVASDAHPPEPIPPELLAWARQTFDAQEFLDGVREIEATGGRSFESLIAAVEDLVGKW